MAELLSCRSSLGRVSWTRSAFTPDDAQHQFAVLARHLAAFLADDTAMAHAEFAGPPPFIAVFFAHLPVLGTPADAMQRMQTMVEAEFRYVIVIMLGDEEMLRLLADPVLPHVTSA